MRLFVIFLILLTIAGSIAFADDVYLRNGQVIKNCSVIDTVDTQIIIQTTQRELALPVANIATIVKSPFDPYKQTEVKKISKFPDSAFSTKSNEDQYTYPNAKLLPVTLIAFVLFWDSFAEVSDLNGQIDDRKKLNVDTSELESRRNRKALMGVVFVDAGLLNTAIALKRVKVVAGSNSLGLSYSF